MQFTVSTLAVASICILFVQSPSWEFSFKTVLMLPISVQHFTTSRWQPQTFSFGETLNSWRGFCEKVEGRMASEKANVREIQYGFLSNRLA
ncbi:hypothetical protein CDAR_432821 [Caerostris darwini]|uniref:Secreted protein n=1 Tax=Caerostris darwini TaxID=1538125 RepID=A0AAV4QHE6_9ARAC|nr:hypothetical protein CDAR_432821 [Caerostris darwini]